jgi:hypothetical protein
MTRTYLDFEKPIAELESKIEDLKSLEDGQSSVSIEDEVKQLELKAKAALEQIYASLTPWQKTQVARHPERPHRGLRSAGRRSLLFRRSRHPGRRRTFSRAVRCRHRQRKRERYRVPP